MTFAQKCLLARQSAGNILAGGILISKKDQDQVFVFLEGAPCVVRAGYEFFVKQRPVPSWLLLLGVVVLLTGKCGIIMGRNDGSCGITISTTF